VETTYVYKSDGLRYNKATNGTTTTHIWDGANIAAELTGSTVTTYVRGINLITKGGGSQYYSFNVHGDVMQLTNSSGTVTKDYRYDAFGVEVDPQGTDTNPWRYCGEYWDKETNAYYLRARHYAPIIGRFFAEDAHWNPENMIYGDNLQKDNHYKDPLELDTYTLAPNTAAIMQSGNHYIYCMNNSIAFQDPSGQIILGTDTALLPRWPLPHFPSMSIPKFPALPSEIGLMPFALPRSNVAQATRSPYPPVIRNHSDTRKDAYEKAKKAGGGKEPISHPNGDKENPLLHFHPNVTDSQKTTPKLPTSHDHYYYPKGLAPFVFDINKFEFSYGVYVVVVTENAIYFSDGRMAI
jgi:RHS repeat-associated protein